MEESIKATCKQNKYGFYEIINKPTEKELARFYAEKYYQGEKSIYRSTYPKDEIRYFEIRDDLKLRIINKLVKFSNAKLLDIGCGEGFTLSYFSKNNWKVKGLDFSSFGCESMNVDQLKNLVAGNIYDSLNEIEEKDEKFDVIIMNNLLEHVLDPVKIVIQINALLNDNGVLVVQVPNDFSYFQQFLKEKKHIKNDFWITYPDHMNYFTRKSLKTFLEEFGWKESYVLAEFPIDLFLANEHSNYINKPETGKAAHQARIELMGFFYDTDPEKAIEMFNKMAELGFGRQIVGFFQKKS